LQTLFMSGCNRTGYFAFFSKGTFLNNCLFERFHLSVEGKLYLLWFGFQTIGLKKVGPLFHPIRNKTRINLDS